MEMDSFLKIEREQRDFMLMFHSHCEHCCRKMQCVTVQVCRALGTPTTQHLCLVRGFIDVTEHNSVRRAFIHFPLKGIPVKLSLTQTQALSTDGDGLQSKGVWGAGTVLPPTFNGTPHHTAVREKEL